LTKAGKEAEKKDEENLGVAGNRKDRGKVESFSHGIQLL
jgi:hypothetical protein